MALHTRTAADLPWPDRTCRVLTIGTRRTSLRMEPYMWESLAEIVEREGTTADELCTQIDRRRGHATLTAAVRVFIIAYFRNAAMNSAGWAMEETAPTPAGSSLTRALVAAVPWTRRPVRTH